MAAMISSTEIPVSAPTNSLVNPMLTDMYQISMSYAYWKAGRHNDHAVFDLFFRKNPFKGEFCVFAGLDEVQKHLSSFRFTESDVAYLRTVLQDCDEEFFNYLLSLDCSRMRVFSVQSGTVVFPKIPLLRIEGPLCVGQLLETTLLNLINFPSLIATNAARMRHAAGDDKKLLEFGLRRAQGPDGAVSASKYAYLGGFDGTSNVLAGKLTGIAISGTHAHAYVMTYSGLHEITPEHSMMKAIDGRSVDFLELVKQIRAELGYFHTNNGELAAFISYAVAFPTGTLCLVDTYDTLQSGVLNYICVACALLTLGYTPRGIRLDSGDLSYLSRAARELFRDVDTRLTNLKDEELAVSPALAKIKQLYTGNANATGSAVGGNHGWRMANSIIVASNDINEDVLVSLNRQGHEIDCFGIGTHLVTCQKQPALGCVYKLVEINSIPRIKLSQEVEKLVIPCSKNVYRLYGKDGQPLNDFMTATDEPAPEVGVRLLCRHPFAENLRAYVTPSRVEALLNLVFDGPNGFAAPIESLETARDRCRAQLRNIRNDIVRTLNPTPYKVSTSVYLFDYMHKLWLEEAPVADLS